MANAHNVKGGIRMSVKRDKSYKYYEGSGIREQYMNDMKYHYNHPKPPDTINTHGWFTPNYIAPRHSTIINKSLLKEEDWW